MKTEIPKHTCRNLHNKLAFEIAEIRRLGIERQDMVYFIESGGGMAMTDRFCQTCPIGKFYRRYPNYAQN